MFFVSFCIIIQTLSQKVNKLTLSVYNQRQNNIKCNRYENIKAIGVEKSVNNFGQKIKHLRTLRKLTQYEVAEKMGVARNTVSQWETGERKMSAEQLIKFAQIVCVNLDYFNSPDSSLDTEFFELLSKLSFFFSNNGISEKDKDNAYHDIMRFYLRFKEENNAHEEKKVN